MQCAICKDEVKDVVTVDNHTVCMSCKTELSYRLNTYFKDEELRKAEALAYAVNTDYFD